MNTVTKNKIWYASSLRPYPANEPWFYDAGTLPWARGIEERWPEFKDEINAFIKEKDKAFVSTSSMYKDIDVKAGWSAINFFFWGAKLSDDFKKKCPKTDAYLKSIPGMVSLSISQLAPHTEIAEHEGDTNAIMRCHIGVEIPASLPNCGFKVNNEQRGWQEGKCLVFNDAYRHTAWNNSDKRRIIIIIDVVRPEFLKKKNLICAFIITRHASYAYDKIKLVRIMPVFIKTLLFASILGLVYVFKPIYNLFK